MRARSGFAALAVGASVFVASSAAWAQIQVAVEQSAAAAAHGSGAQLVAQLNDKTYFNFNATLVDNTQVDTAAELSAYDVVILGDSGFNDFDWTPTMADAILNAVQTNGLGVVGTSWIRFSGNTIPSIGAMLPVTTIPTFEYCSGPTITVTLHPGHPISTGLTSFQLPSSRYAEHASSAPDIAGSFIVGNEASTSACTDAVGNVVVAADLGTGRTVYTGLLYLGSPSDYQNDDLRTGAADRLIEQATAWAAHACFTNADCDDGNACNGTETCTKGICSAGTTLICNDNNGCTDDSCAPATGCVFTNNTATCDDASACTTNDVCSNGSCTGTAVVCNDNNGCTDDSCVPATGCVFTNNTATCDDASACTTNDVCSNGSCSGTAVVCNDNDVCTDDSCVPATGCVFTSNTATCDDADLCTTNDVCAADICAGTHIAGCCTDTGQCPTNETCNLATHQCGSSSTSSSASTGVTGSTGSASATTGSGTTASGATTSGEGGSSAQTSTGSSSGGGSGGDGSGSDTGKGCGCRMSDETPASPTGLGLTLAVGLVVLRRARRRQNRR